ncbi:MAG: hypothetical protein ISR00_00980 [Flavobacteriales bacterium]|nr:hypothetical protein [Flavobacteriales bacterium]
MLKEDILQAQNEWGKGVVQIGKNKLEAKEFVSKMYANEILMKPTMAKEQAFRTNHPDIISYFISGHISEDNGFALKPWTKVRFENEGIIFKNQQAFAVGHYYFTDRNSDETKVEYSFGYIIEDGEIKINLHHSSLP